MLTVQKIVKVFLLILIVLPCLQTDVSAEQLNNSVKDWYKPSEKNGDEKPSTTKEKTPKADEEIKVGVTFWDVAKMIFATIFVVALLYFLLKFVNKKSLNYKSSQLVENLGGTSLGANRSVQIVKAGSRLLIVGVGENIQLLKEIDDPDEAGQVLAEYNKKMEQLVQPGDILTKVVEKTKKRSEEKKETNPFADMLKRQLDEIAEGRKKLLVEMEKKGQDKR